MRNIGFKSLVLAITLLILSSSAPPPTPAGNKLKVVVIDAGHGGKDPGTHGVKLKEKDVALKISLKVGEYIKKYLPDVKVIYTRNDDTFVSLDDRAIMANNAKADLFLCIHANAVTRPSTYGTETYVMGLHRTEGNMEIAQRENAVMLLDENYKERYEGFDPNSPESYILFSLTQSAYQEASLRLAQNIESQFKNRVGRHSHGVKQAGFWVLWKTAMPSVLVEVGFLTNANEEVYLGSLKGQEEIASGIFRAFRDYKVQVESLK